jgi:hypothetical protein
MKGGSGVPADPSPFSEWLNGLSGPFAERWCGYLYRGPVISQGAAKPASAARTDLAPAPEART